MRTIKETPGCAVEDGTINYGVFKTPFKDLNLLDAALFKGFGMAARLMRRVRLKEWQHFGIVTDKAFFGLAIVNANFMGLSWFYYYDRKSGQSIEHMHNASPTSVTLAMELWDDRCCFTTRGYDIEVLNNLDNGLHRIEVDISQARELPRVRADVKVIQDPTKVQPLIAVLPIESRRPFYSHKAPCPVSGMIQVGNKRFNLDPKKDLAIIDVHKSFYPYQTSWKWATFAGYDSKGHLIGVNLTHSVFKDDHVYNENAIWHGNRLSLLGAARFEIPEEPESPWIINTEDDRLHLKFQPQGGRRQKIDLGVFLSRYFQPVGLFSGTMVDDAGIRHEVNDIFGMAEKHQVRW